jgi:adenosylhomocysteine nucleosidase
MAMSKLAIIAAMEREVAGFVRGWNRTEIIASFRTVRMYEQGNALVAIAGIGAISARAAADTAYKHANGAISQFVSVGLAGALTPEWKAGDVFRPATIIDEADDLSIATAGGAGTLITAGTIADEQVKRIFAAKHIAQSVDMEAYAVGDVARIYGVPFTAIKVISDELDFPMPPLARFVSDRGDFRTRAFAMYAALRPWLWPTMLRLGSNSGRAAAVLRRELEVLVGESAAAKPLQ